MKFQDGDLEAADSVAGSRNNDLWLSGAKLFHVERRSLTCAPFSQTASQQFRCLVLAMWSQNAPRTAATFHVEHRLIDGSFPELQTRRFVRNSTGVAVTLEQTVTSPTWAVFLTIG